MPEHRDDSGTFPIGVHWRACSQINNALGHPVQNPQCIEAQNPLAQKHPVRDVTNGHPRSTLPNSANLPCEMRRQPGARYRIFFNIMNNHRSDVGDTNNERCALEYVHQHCDVYW